VGSTKRYIILLYLSYYQTIDYYYYLVILNIAPIRWTKYIW